MDEPKNSALPEPVFTTAEVAAEMKVHAETVRRIFSDEPGVLKISSKNGRGRRVTLRIPQHVLQRVLRKLEVPLGPTGRRS